MSDILTATREELIVLVYDLIDRVHAQETQIAYLKDQLHQKGKNNTPMVKPPAFVKASVQKKKKAPRKKREGSYHRTREVPTQQIFHSFSHCPNCNDRLLGKGSVGYTRTVIELPIVSYQVIEHTVLKHWCINCQKRVMPTVDFSSETLGHGNIGINLASTIVTMRDRLRLPLPVIKTYLKLFYQLDLSIGELTEILHTVAAAGKPQYDNLLEQIRKSDSIHADETGGRAATPPDIRRSVDLIRSILSERLGNSIAQHIRILYGGSVDKSNIQEFLQEGGVQGALVGQMSLHTNEFIALVHRAAMCYG